MLQRRDNLKAEQFAVIIDDLKQFFIHVEKPAM
jgi:hypothetical protein